MDAAVTGIVSGIGLTSANQPGRIADAPAGAYFLSAHVHLCITADWPVILDLRTTRYGALTRVQAQVLSQHVVGWPEVGSDGCPSKPVPQRIQDKVLTELTLRDVLTADRSVGKPATPIRCDRPRGSLTKEDLFTKPRVSLSDTGRFYRAMLAAKRQLREKSLHTLVEYIRTRRLRARSVRQCEPERARELVQAFRHLRPLLFNGRDECLLDSIGLMEYVIPEGFIPDWVIGVRTRPFVAHSWLCSGGLVWGDLPDYVANFTPIAKF